MKKEMKTKVMIAGAAFCAALFLFSGFMLCREYLDQKQSAEAFEEVAELVKEEPELPALELESEQEPVQEEVTAFDKYADVYAQNSDLVGWVSIPGTQIDYPVMQTKDNPDFYLKHAFDKSYSSYGVPYVQENCDIGISDNLVLYGHHMNNGSMFSDLCKYESEDFYQEHRIIHFDTLESFGEYEVIAAFKTVAYSEEGFTPHMLRHTYITNLIHSSVDPKTVQYLAGHKSSKITMDIYAKVKYNKPDQLAGLLNSAFVQWDADGRSAVQ